MTSAAGTAARPPGPAASSRSSLREEPFVHHKRKTNSRASGARYVATALLTVTTALLMRLRTRLVR